MRTNRILPALLSLLLLCALLPLPGGARAEGAENVLRLHILANSDSEADQAVKLRVRDALLEIMPETGSAAEAEQWLLQNGANVLTIAERVLRENGFPYGAQLLLGESEFPDRSYDGTAFPAGTYRALRVILGNGAGHNWWCVLFPPLCIVTKDAEPLPDADDIRYESAILRWIRSWKEKNK